MSSAPAKSVAYGASRYGYKVTAYDAENRPVQEYEAGNSRFDSGAYVEPGKGSSLPLQTLRRYARQTAGDIAAALGVPAERIGEDKDAAPDFSEAYRHGR